MKRPWIKECALAHSRAEARLPRQPSTPAPSAHPRGAFLSYGNEVSYTIKKSCFTEFSACDGTRKRQLSIPPQAGSHFPMKQHSIVMKKAVTRQTIAGATAIFHNLFQ